MSWGTRLALAFLAMCIAFAIVGYHMAPSEAELERYFESRAFVGLQALAFAIGVDRRFSQVRRSSERPLFPASVFAREGYRLGAVTLLWGLLCWSMEALLVRGGAFLVWILFFSTNVALGSQAICFLSSGVKYILRPNER